MNKQAKETLQRMIDKGAAHMRQQGKCALDSHGDCAYRAEDGSKCFIGVFITDEQYTAHMESESPYQGLVGSALIANGFDVVQKGMSTALVDAQETLHDDLWEANNFLYSFELALEDYCSKYGLTYPEPEETT